MPSYTLTPVRGPINFTGTAEADVQPTYTWLDPFPSTAGGGGYYTFNSTGTRVKLQFSASDLDGMYDSGGTYTNNQYVVGRLGDLAATGATNAKLGGFLHCSGPTTAGTSAQFYLLEISQDTTTTPLTTKIFRVTTGNVRTEIGSINNVTWANNDRFLFVDYDGTIEVYRDSGSGFGSTAILSVNDTASRLTGGTPGFVIRRPDTYTLDDVEFGDATLAVTSTLGPSTLDLANVDPTGTLGQNPAQLGASTLTLDNIAPTGTLGIAPGSVTTLPFSRNTGSRPTGLTGVAVAILSDDANMTRLAGATSLSQDGAGRVVYSGAGLPSFGTSVLVVTREPDGKLGLERYTVQ